MRARDASGRTNGRDADGSSPSVRRQADAMATSRTVRRAGLLNLQQRIGPGALLQVQASAGNRAAVSLISRNQTIPSRIGAPLQVQRGSGSELDTARTLTWEVADESEVQAKLVRRTKIEADAWGEVGPHPPRIKYERTVDLSTRDGRRAHLHIGITVYLMEGERLPQSPEEALARVGRRGIRGHCDFTAEGDDLIANRDPRWYELSPGISMQALSGRFPAYAAWSISAEQQEAAILRHLDSLPRRRIEAAKEEGDQRGIAAKVAGVVTDMAPVTGNLKDAYRFAFGRDPDTNEQLGWGARIMAGIFAIPGLGNALKWIGKPFRWLGRTALVRRAANSLRGRVHRLWKRLTGKAAPKSLPSPTPRLKVARGHEMLGESLEHLKNAPPGRRIEMFDDFAKQIEEASKGTWSATKSVLQDGTAVFVGSAGHTLVITTQGKVYKGMLGNPSHFTLGKGGIPIPHFGNLKEHM